MIFPKTRGLLLSLLVSLGLLGCNPLTYLSFAFPPSLSVNELRQATEGTVIYIQGIVKAQVPFVGNGAYQLEDQTGRIWVVTNHLLPQPGEQITIKGQIAYQSIPIAGQDLGEFYLVEIEKVDPASETTSPDVPSPPSEVNSPQPTPSRDLDDLFFPHKQNVK